MSLSTSSPAATAGDSAVVVDPTCVERPPVDRRRFLGAVAAAMLARGATSAAADQPAVGEGEPFAFFVVADTHYLADKNAPAKLDAESLAHTRDFVDLLRKLPGTPIPQTAGGGRVRAVGGLLHCGDVIDSGDKNGRTFEEMQRTEWAAFEEDYGLRGGDGKLPFPVYELHGNHDSPGGAGHAIDRIVERNRSRPGVIAVSDNGLHYAWRFGPLHMVNLGITVGSGDERDALRQFNPRSSLEFLQSHLAKHVGESRRPVVVSHHLDVAQYSKPCDPGAPPTKPSWWTACDVRNFYEALRPYNVVALFNGHTHARRVQRWNGTPKPDLVGYRSFNGDDASHFHGRQQGMFYGEATGARLVVREYATRDAWKSAAWTSEGWSGPLEG